MTILRDFSLIWCVLHTLALFLMLFEPRYPWKKTVSVLAATMIPLISFNILLFVFVGIEKTSSLMLLSMSLPSCIVFWFLAKYRDGRFFFTFCMVDTIVLEITYLSNIVNHYVSPDTYLFLFFARLISLPLLEWFVLKKIRHSYLETQTQVRSGWSIFAVIGVILYLAIALLMTTPTLITDRPEQLLPMLLLFILQPTLYAHILITLRRQQQYFYLKEQESILKLQVDSITARIEEISSADEKLRIERHNLRHTMQTIASLAESQQYQELLDFVEEYNGTIKETQIRHYCTYPVLDAVLSSYLNKATRNQIDVSTSLAFPDVLPVREAELAAVFANAIENAINACTKLSAEKRILTIQVISEPQFMIHIRNSFKGHVRFDQKGIPISPHTNHGLGTRSIAAFCEKRKVFYDFQTEGHIFSLRLIFSQKI